MGRRNRDAYANTFGEDFDGDYGLEKGGGRKFKHGGYKKDWRYDEDNEDVDITLTSMIIDLLQRHVIIAGLVRTRTCPLLVA
eukprot:g80552.t1